MHSPLWPSSPIFSYLSSLPPLDTCFTLIGNSNILILLVFHCPSPFPPLFTLLKFHGLTLITLLDISLKFSLKSSYSPGKTITLVSLYLLHAYSQEANHDWKKNASVKRSHFKFDEHKPQVISKCCQAIKLYWLQVYSLSFS